MKTLKSPAKPLAVPDLTTLMVVENELFLGVLTFLFLIMMNMLTHRHVQGFIAAAPCRWSYPRHISPFKLHEGTSFPIYRPTVIDKGAAQRVENKKGRIKIDEAFCLIADATDYLVVMLSIS